MKNLKQVNSVSQLNYILNLALIANRDNSPRNLFGWEKELGRTYPYPVTRNLLSLFIKEGILVKNSSVNGNPMYVMNIKRLKEALEGIEVIRLTREVLDIYHLLF